MPMTGRTRRWCRSGTGDCLGQVRAAGQAAWRVAGGLVVVGIDPA